MKSYFTKFEIVLLLSSIILIISSFLLFDKENYLTLLASLIGVFSLILAAKGNPIAQVLMVVFSILYGIISYTFSYYGEMITYLCMTMPMSVFSLISWIRNPYKGNKAQVAVNRVGNKEFIFLLILSIVVTFIFYFILKYFDTANIIPSTVSVTTSFIAVYLTFRRSPYYALGYTANDMVLIVLWIMASLTDKSYISVVICFIVFLVNDLYGLISWLKMQKNQAAGV